MGGEGNESCNEGDEGEEGCGHGGQGHEAGDEGEEACLCALGEAPCLLWQDHQDCVWPEEDGFGEEQGGQDCEQEGERQWQEELVDRRRQQGAQGAEDQGVLRREEGHPPLQDGEGAHVSIITCSPSVTSIAPGCGALPHPV